MKKFVIGDDVPKLRLYYRLDVKTTEYKVKLVPINDCENLTLDFYNPYEFYYDPSDEVVYPDRLKVKGIDGYFTFLVDHSNRRISIRSLKCQSIEELILKATIYDCLEN